MKLFPSRFPDPGPIIHLSITSPYPLTHSCDNACKINQREQDAKKTGVKESKENRIHEGERFPIVEANVEIVTS
jgi:hypothetical protein